MRPCSPVILDAVTLGIGGVVGHLLATIELALGGIDGINIGLASFLEFNYLPDTAIDTNTFKSL